VTGGIPQYLKAVSRAKTVEAGIESAYFTKDGFLYEEPQNLLKQELREPALYNSIIAAVAGGATKLNEIATKVKETDSKVAKYIKNLIGLGIIEKEKSIFAESERSSIYCIKDNMYRFWYRFVPGVVTLVENGYENIYEKKIKQFMPEFMGRVFEVVCLQYLIRLNIKDELPFLFDTIGRWWGGSPITKKETEIDLIAVSKNKLIVGECKWQNEEIGQKVYKDVKEKAAMFTDKDIYYYLFSKAGFTTGLIEEAKRDNKLKLVGLDDLFVV
jgi:AAA+ ATPase superfamily predicted ATPase